MLRPETSVLPNEALVPERNLVRPAPNRLTHELLVDEPYRFDRPERAGEPDECFRAGRGSCCMWRALIDAAPAMAAVSPSRSGARACASCHTLDLGRRGLERARRGARRRRPRPRRPLKKSDDPPSPRQPSRCTPSRIACRTRTVWQCRPVPSLSGLLPPAPCASKARLPPSFSDPLRRAAVGSLIPLGHSTPRGALRARSATGRVVGRPDVTLGLAVHT